MDRMLRLLLLALISGSALAEIPQIKQAGDHYVIRGDSWCWGIPYYTAEQFFPPNWMLLDEAGQKFGWPESGPDVKAACALHYIVAPNRGYDSRPLYDRDGKQIGRVDIGMPCGDEIVRPYSDTVTSLAWRPVAGGVAVCEEVK